MGVFFRKLHRNLAEHEPELGQGRFFFTTCVYDLLGKDLLQPLADQLCLGRAPEGALNM